MGDSEVKIIGVLTRKVIDTFSLTFEENAVILCGNGNIEHMKNTHPEDYAKYGDKIADIIKDADYICKHPDKTSIEYVKIFTDENGDHVLVAVRATGAGTLYARTLFVMDPEKIKKYNEKNAFKPYR